MSRLSAYWLAVPALVCVSAVPSAYAISPDSQAYVRQLNDRNADKAQRIQQRLAGIEGQKISDAERAKAKDDFLKAEIEKAEADEKVAAQFGGAEGQATAREVTTILKALREQERWEAARGGPNADAPNRAQQILRDGAGQAAVDQQIRYKAEIDARIRHMAEQAAQDDMRIMREYEEQKQKQAEEEQRRRQTSMAPSQDQDFWDSALRYAGEFGGFRVANGPGFLGRESTVTFARELGLVQPDKSSDNAFRSMLNATWNLSSSVEPLKLWSSTANASTWMSIGGQYADYSRKSSWDIFDVGPTHRVLITGTGDAASPDREGFSIGPGGGFNLVRDVFFREDSDTWSAWGKFGQTCDYGSFTLSGYALAAYSQVETRQAFGGRLPNIGPAGFDFRYDTRVDTGVGSFGVGVNAEMPVDEILGGSSFANNLSIYGGATATADFIRSSGRDHLRVERPTVFTSTQFVDMRETDVEAGYELNLGFRYKLNDNWTADLGGRYGSHKTGIGIERIGTAPSDIEHLGQDSWGVGIGVTWRN